MNLPYRPMFLKRAALASRETPKRRVARRLNLVHSAPAPRTAPAALYADDGRVFLPGPVLAYSDDYGVVLYRDGAAPGWPKGRDPEPPPVHTTPPAWSLWLQGVLLVTAIIGAGIVGVRFWP